MGDPRNEIETLKDRIQSGEREVSDDDREVLIEFSRRLDLLREEYSDHRHLKLLRHTTRIAENVGGLADALDSREATEEIVRWIHSTYDNEETNRDYRVALRVFGRRVSDGDDEDPPESIAWVSSKTSRSYDPAPDPADMLAWEEDVKPMIEEARNPRDKALVAVQFDAGLRGGELYNLTVGDVSDSQYGMRVRVDGKTGQRSVDLIPSVPYLQRWLSEHPAGDDPDTFLWSKLNSPDRYSYQRFLQCFKEAGANAGVEKPVTPTNFRKSNATWLARQGQNAALIEDRQGRSRGSKAVARYVARFGDDAEAQYARFHGKEVEEDERDDLAPVECPRCGRDTPVDEDFCQWCYQALDYEGASELRGEQREVRKAALRFIKSNPELLDEIEAATDLSTLFEENPELHEDARAFADALSDG
jgi:integrase